MGIQLRSKVILGGRSTPNPVPATPRFHATPKFYTEILVLGYVRRDTKEGKGKSKYACPRLPRPNAISRWLPLSLRYGLGHHNNGCGLLRGWPANSRRRRACVH